MIITINNKIEKLTGKFFLGFDGPINITRKTDKFTDIHFKTVLINKGRAFIFDSIRTVKKEIVSETVENLNNEIYKSIAKEKSRLEIFDYSLKVNTNFIKEIAESELN